MPDYESLAPGRTVLHGVDQSVDTNANLPARANFAARCMTEDVLGHNFYDVNEALWKPQYVIPFEFSATDYSTVGSHGLGVTVPAGTIIMDAFFDVLESVTSDGAATIRFDLESASDIKTATGKATWAEGLLAAVPTGAAANMIKTTDDREVTAVIGTAALTAGHIIGYLRCVNSWLAAAIQSSSSSSSNSSSSSSHSSSSASSSTSSSS